MNKRVYRSRTDRVIGGVCSGLAEYFNMDPTLMRIVFVVLIFAKGIGLLAYIIGWILIPERKEEEVEGGPATSSTASRFLPGLILVVIGLIFLFNNFFFWFSFKMLWPIVLIVLGIYIIAKL
jgi:phage shock protein PspC (stress-responsive transcriptional regulator)